MSKTTRNGVTSTSKRKHDSRNTNEATYYASKAYMRPMVAIKAQVAELNLREQVNELFTQDTSYNPWPRDLSMHARSRFYSQSTGYRFVEPMRVEEWELQLLAMRQEYATRAPAIEHVIPRERRLNTLNVTNTVAQLREAEAKYGPESGYVHMLRERAAQERRDALKHESITRFGYLPALGK